MKQRIIYLIGFLIFPILLLACGGRDLPSSLGNTTVLDSTGAIKTINSFDEMGCEVYETGVMPKSSECSIERLLSSDAMEGQGSFKFKYTFTGGQQNMPESVFFQQTWADYRSDLSFHPLALSIWVKGDLKNKGTFRFMIIQDIDEFNEEKPHDKDRWQYFEYVDKNVLSKGEWTRLVIPYDKFKFSKGRTVGKNKLELNRFLGYRIEVTNEDSKPCSGEFCIDNLEQLTSYKPHYGKPMFSSIFIQPYDGYAGKNWEEDFRASMDIGIDTWIVQYAGQFSDKADSRFSFYTPTSLPWVSGQSDIINKMFEAASKTGVKLILGLYPGDYSNKDTSTPEQYELLLERNKKQFDELYALFGQHPNLAGWYITEEFHDGSFPVGWQQEPSLSLLAKYLQNVAAYVKSKSSKTVSIAPALWRGMPADLCGQWFGKIFAQTPDIDVLYLQDIGGRCQVDFDVDLPNWFAEIKKACDAHGVAFGVDIESFKSCWCPNVPMQAKKWSELVQQLLVAGLFTEHITNFSWATFHPGTDGYENYKKYLKENGLIK